MEAPLYTRNLYSHYGNYRESRNMIPEGKEFLNSSLWIGLCPPLARIELPRLCRASPSATLWVLADMGVEGLWPLRQPRGTGYPALWAFNREVEQGRARGTHLHGSKVLTTTNVNRDTRETGLPTYSTGARAHRTPEPHALRQRLQSVSHSLSQQSLTPECRA